MTRIQVYQGDITTLEVDAIVNAANESLTGGGGVDGAIHRAAGPGLLAACRSIGGCPTGKAVITPGFELPANYVIHTVGPVWQGGDRGEPGLLADCYRNSLDLAARNDLDSIAFPAISCGVYGYPGDEATSTAIRAIKSWLENYPDRLSRIILVGFSNEMNDLLADVLEDERVEFEKFN